MTAATDFAESRERGIERGKIRPIAVICTFWRRGLRHYLLG
mgnify:FL=1